MNISRNFMTAILLSCAASSYALCTQNLDLDEKNSPRTGMVEASKESPSSEITDKKITVTQEDSDNLALDANEIGEEGARAIATALPNLTTLNLNLTTLNPRRRNTIGEEGARALAALPNLTHLDLTYLENMR